MKKLMLPFGWLLLITGPLGLVCWWLILVPASNTSLPGVDTNQSLEGFWHYKQMALKAGWWTHESGGEVGYFGGKEWVEPIIASLRSGEGFSCGAGHRDSAISTITNHDFFPDSAWDSRWDAWWSANNHKSMEEWIQDGFKEEEIIVSLPPTEADWPALLNVMGTMTGPAPERSRKPYVPVYEGHLRYNAYRWLRDSGFDPVDYLLQHHNQPLSLEMLRGIDEYNKQHSFLQAPLPGRMSFAEESSDNIFDLFGYGYGKMPRLLKKPVLVGVSAVLLILSFSGMIMIHVATKLKPVAVS